MVCTREDRGGSAQHTTEEEEEETAAAAVVEEAGEGLGDFVTLMTLVSECVTEV